MPECKIVAEIGINHNGNWNTARSLIKKAKEAGCDFVKFQKRTIEKVYTKEELDKPRESPWGKTNREQKEHLEFDERGYDCINSVCHSEGMPWFASPWDVESVFFLTKYNLRFIKIPSALITNKRIIKAIKVTNIPVILSTGMSTQAEVYEIADELGDQIEYILACTSTYPTKVNEINLQFIKNLSEEFNEYKVGFSNHSPGIIFMLAAAALGARMIEFHITLDRSMYGSDQAASIEPTGMRRVVEDIRSINKAMGDGQWTVFESEKLIRDKLRR